MIIIKKQSVFLNKHFAFQSVFNILDRFDVLISKIIFLK